MARRARSGATRAALVALALWSSLAAMGLRLAHVPPFFLVGATLVVGGLLGAHRVRWRALRARHVALGVYGLFAYHLCLFLALRLAPPVEANLVNYLWPLLLVVLAPWFVPGLTVRAHHLAGALLGFGGAALLLVGEAGAAGRDLTGHALALAAAVIWATYSLATRRMGAATASATAAYCLVSGALALGVHAVLEPPVTLGAEDALWLLAAGVGPMGASFYLWEHAMTHGDPRAIGTLAYLTPLASTTLVALTEGTALTARVALAGAAILAGAALGAWERRAPGAPRGAGGRP